MPSASSHVRLESSAASSTSLTLCLDRLSRAVYRVLRQAGRTEPEGLPGPYPSRHAVPPWSRLHGQPERIREAVPMGISAVPNGNIRDVSGRCLSAISPVSKRAITHFLPDSAGRSVRLFRFSLQARTAGLRPSQRAPAR